MILAGLAFLLVAICGLGFAWMISGLDSKVTITELAEYPKLIKAFPPHIAGHLPAEIPAQAANATLNYFQASGLGPSTRWLDVSFELPPDQAAAFFLECRSRVLGPDTGAVFMPSDHEIRITYGDRVSTVRIDPTSGLVSIEVHLN